MRRIDRLIVYYWVSVVALFIMSAMLLLMPFSVENGQQKPIFVVVVGITFWLSALIGYAFAIAANSVRKQIMHLLSGSHTFLDGKVGVISFFSNIYASIADVILIISFVSFVLINFSELNTSYLAYVFLFLLVFSLNMHCMFNGKIFKMIQASKKITHTRRNNFHE